MKDLASITHRLENIKHQLKTEFIGLDHIIDQLIQAVNPWCSMGENQRRPLIVNLWGMTGVGKTSLVKRFLDLWDTDENVIQFNVASKSLMEQILHGVEKLYSLNGKKSVLIFDEFQHARTLDESGRELQKPIDRMIWQLMDEGRFNFSGWRGHHANLQELATGIELCLQRGVKVEKGHVVAGWDTYFDIMERGEIPKKFRSSNPNTFFLSGSEIHELHEFTQHEFPVRSQFKDFLLQMDGPELFAFCKKVAQKSLTSAHLDFSRSLIFVIGNLDEGFAMSAGVSTDQDADLLHLESKKISFDRIKQALRNRFRMEEIARLGNIHLIYPSLSSDVYRTFINRELVEIGQRFEEIFPCNIQFSDRVKATLFEEGVVPNQGFRPLRSTIRYLIEGNLLELLQRIHSRLPDNLLIDNPGDDLVVCYEGHVLSRKKLHLPIRETKRKQHDAEQLAITAVHEAGHALVYLILHRCWPKTVSISSADLDKAGFMQVNPSSGYANKDVLMRRIATLLAGKKAEELVFGSENLTTGSEQDVKTATTDLLFAFRDGSLNRKPAGYESRIRGSGKLLEDPKEAELWVEQQLTSGYQLAEQVLVTHKTAFQAIVSLLMEHKRLDTEGLAAGLQRKGVDGQQLLNAYPPLFHYSQRVQDFLKEGVTRKVGQPA